MYNNNTKKRWLNSSVREDMRNLPKDKLMHNSNISLGAEAASLSSSSSSLITKYVEASITSSPDSKGLIVMDLMKEDERKKSKNKKNLGNTGNLNNGNDSSIKWTEDKIDNCKRCLEHFLNSNKTCQNLKKKNNIKDNLVVSDYITTKESIKFYVKSDFIQAPSIEELYNISSQLSKEIPGFSYSNEMPKFTTHSIFKATKIEEEEEEGEEGSIERKRRRPTTILLPTQECTLTFVYKPHSLSDPKITILLAILCLIIACVFSLRFYYIYSEQGYTLINAIKEMFYYHWSSVNIIESTDL